MGAIFKLELNCICKNINKNDTTNKIKLTANICCNCVFEIFFNKYIKNATKIAKNTATVKE